MKRLAGLCCSPSSVSIASGFPFSSQERERGREIAATK